MRPSPWLPLTKPRPALPEVGPSTGAIHVIEAASCTYRKEASGEGILWPVLLGRPHTQETVLGYCTQRASGRGASSWDEACLCHLVIYRVRPPKG